MKKSVLVIVLLMVAVSAMAKQAHVMVSPASLKGDVPQEDSLALLACPQMAGGVLNYKDDQDLAEKLAAIEEYFAEHPLQKRYSLKFMDAKTLTVVGDVTVGGGKRVSVTGNENKDQLVMGIGAAVLAVLLLALSALLGKAGKARWLTKPASVILLLLGLFSGLLAIIWTVSLGLKTLMAVCGPALIIGAAILLLAGSAKGGSAAGASAASSPKTSQTPHGYSVNGQHFDSFGEAALYVKQFSYMDNSWIKPE